MSKGSTVIVYTENYNETTQNVLVPNFINMTAAEANATAASVGINIELSGNISSVNEASRAYKQSVEAGTEVEQGSVITVFFRDSGNADIAQE